MRGGRSRKVRAGQAGVRSPAVAGLLAFLSVLTGGAACSHPSPSTPGRVVPAPFTVSYAEAASRLERLPEADTLEQVRDWTRTALALRLGVSADAFRDSSYDLLPVREDTFADMARQPVGPGRALPDGRGVLHVLVQQTDQQQQGDRQPRKGQPPRKDQQEDRTVGLLLDQYRADSGTDPSRVQVHRYRIDTKARTVAVTDLPVEGTPAARTTRGYREARVDSLEGLRSFLSTTTSLSRLERRGTELWAGGWNWAVPATARVDAADVSALERGYAPDSTQRPGFSLDPAPVRTTEDLLAVVPGIGRDLAERILHGGWPAGGFASSADLREVVEGRLMPRTRATPDPRASRLPSDRTQLWALARQLSGQAPYSQARYDGGLVGTEVGMTLFYADYVAKNWVVGTGSGTPATQVPGFVADNAAKTPWSHCPTEAEARAGGSEQGRLWFGQNDSAFRTDPDAVSIGSEPTRLFVRVEQGSRADGGANEADPDYTFGRGIRWWDRHYLDIADYEPQYQRLDQIMRWSGALDWLASTSTTADRPRLPATDVTSDLTFTQWYQRHTELRERSAVRFVHRQGSDVETVAAPPTNEFTDCGYVAVKGGVSLADRSARHPGADLTDRLPASVARAQDLGPGSVVEPSTGAGQITHPADTGRGRVRRSWKPAPGGGSEIITRAPGHTVVALGTVRMVRSEDAERTLGTTIRVKPAEVSESVAVQGQDLGTLTTRLAPNAVWISWKWAWLGRLQVALESAQAAWARQRDRKLPEPTQGPFYRVMVRGRAWWRLGPRKWLVLSNQEPPATAQASYRVGAEGSPPGAPPQQAFGTVVDHPPDLAGPAGTTSRMVVAPATRDQVEQLAPAGGPLIGGASPFTVTDARGGKHTLHVGPDGKAEFDLRDPLFQLDGPIEGAALLADLPRLREAQRTAIAAADGLLRGVQLGDGAAALVGADEVLLVPAGHHHAEAVARARKPSGPTDEPLFSVKDGQVLTVVTSPVTTRGDARRARLRDLLADPKNVVYLKLKKAEQLQAVIAPGPLITLPQAHDLYVRFVAAEPTAALTAAPSLAGRADILVRNGSQWWRVDSVFPTPRPGSFPPRPFLPGASPPGASPPESSPPGAGDGGNGDAGGPVPDPTTSGPTPWATTSGPMGPSSQAGRTAPPTPPATVLLACPDDGEECTP
jgi:hypothetical protein